MPSVKSLCLFALRFALAFGLLAFPWPGWRDAFAGIIQAELRVTLNAVFPARVIQVGRHDDKNRPSADTEIIVGAKKDTGTTGALPSRGAAFDSRSLGWMPHAMILALCAATPLGWKERWKVLAAGLLSTHVLVLTTFVVGVLPGVGAETSNPWVYWTSAGANQVLVQNLWMSFVGPFLLWVLCLFRFCGGAFNIVPVIERG